MDIAIIGTGISGLGVAYLLHNHHNITVYEKNDYIGGHSRTMDVITNDGAIAVDTGFIVFNRRNYPLLCGLFKHLNVPIIESNMSFGVSIDQGRLEYGTLRPHYLFSQRRNLLRPSFWRMLADILKFNRRARVYLQKDPAITLGQCLDELGLGLWFRDYYLLAMGGAIWSTPLQDMLSFPAQTFVRFFENHGLLTVTDQPQWYTVKGGSREYVKRLTTSFRDCIALGHGVERVVRHDGGVDIHDSQGLSRCYDQVIFACHADQALAMLENANDRERNILSAFQYQKNTAYLHSDTTLMPRRKQAWSSWTYLQQQRTDRRPGISLSYWMNNLQALNTNTPIIVTLNPAEPSASALTYDRHVFEHPLFTRKAIAAQQALPQIQGTNRTWYCGAYQRYGFHEDGLLSAVNVAKQLGASIPWT